MASWALFLSLVVFLPFALLVSAALAITVLVRSKDGRPHGKGRAIAALVIDGCWLLAIVVVGILALVGVGDPDRDSSGRVVESTVTSIGDLRVGDCFDQEATLHTGDETADVAEATVKPCSQPHQFEEYATFELDPGSYPGEDAISRIAEQRCFGMLRAYAGSPAKLREYSVYYFFPRPVDWKLRHDRLVQCLLGHDDGPTTGSLRRS